MNTVVTSYSGLWNGYVAKGIKALKLLPNIEVAGHMRTKLIGNQCSCKLQGKDNS